jgi:hypothetical protein
MSKARREIGRPQLEGDIEQLIARMARANLRWGYDRIAGALPQQIGFVAAERRLVGCATFVPHHWAAINAIA